MGGPEAIGIKARSRELALLMVDVEGSTRLWQGDSTLAEAAMTRYARLVAEVVVRGGGWLPPEQGEGDGRFAAFEDPAAAVAAALGVQQTMQAQRWPTESALLARVGVHAGEVLERDGVLLGEPVHRCARICAAGHGGQVLLSEAVAVLVADRLPADGWLRDLGQHRLRDMAEPERLFQLQHPDLAAEFPALRALHATGHQLPLQLDSFVGRERELAEVPKMLDSHRLVTLTGPGGSGKTRLSLQVAAELASEGWDEGAGQVVFVDLAPLADPALLAERLAAALGVRTSPDAPVADTIAVVLAGRRVLLVADNCEHLPTAGRVLADLVMQAGGVRVLATSREPLRVRGEQEYPVLPLAVPSDADEGAAPLSPAMQLFADRAAAVRPDFLVDATNSATLGTICRRLDGLPLAIELAAPWLRTLSPAALLAQLARPLDLLAQPDGARADRHRTLRATIDWSYQRLDLDQQRLLAAMAVFAGGADLDALTDICALDLNASVLGVVAALVDKNLVQPVPASFPPRFRLLETIREFASERLAESDHEGKTIAAHAAWFAGWARVFSGHSEGPGAEPWLVRALAEADNLRAAIDHLERSERHDEQLQLVVDLMGLWFDCGLDQEGLTRLQRALDASSPQAPPRALALAQWAFLSLGLGAGAALGRAREAVALARARGDAPVESFALQVLGYVLADTDEGEQVLRAAIDVARRARGHTVRHAETSPDVVEMSANHALANRWMYRSISESIRYRREAVRIGERAGDRRGTVLPLCRLAESLMLAGDLVAARGALDRAGAFLQDQFAAHYDESLASTQALLAHYEGRTDDAEHGLGAVVAEAKAAGRLVYLAFEASRLVDLLVDCGRLDEAETALSDAQLTCQPVDRDQSNPLPVRRARLSRIKGHADEGLLAALGLDLDRDMLAPHQIIWYVESAALDAGRGDSRAALRHLHDLAAASARTGILIPPWEQRQIDGILLLLED